MSTRVVIAVVDDDRIYTEMIRDFLDGEGYDSILIHQASIAVETIARSRPALVLLDIRMDQPDSGVAILTQLRAIPTTAEIPVVICTADQQFLTHHAGRVESQFTRVIAKPFDLDHLLDTIQHTLGGLPRSSTQHDNGHDASS